MAQAFVEWLPSQPSAHWLDVGCGTGALTSTICRLCDPASVVACDPAEPFIEHARRSIAAPRVSFVVAGADALPSRAGGFDAIVSGLVLNFLPQPDRVVSAMRDRLRPGGLVAAYVWDYSEGLEFLRHFWDAVVALDPGAAALDEGARFPLCHAPALAALFEQAGLARVETASLAVPTDFAGFDDYWTPFLGGTGPAPAYVASLDAARKEALRARLERRLRPGEDGGIHLRARAWAVRGCAT